MYDYCKQMVIINHSESFINGSKSGWFRGFVGFLNFRDFNFKIQNTIFHAIVSSIYLFII